MIKSLLGKAAVKAILSDDLIQEPSNKCTFLRLLTVRDAAEILGCSSKQIYRYLNMGLLKDCLVQLGNLRTVRFHPRKLMECIDRGHFTAEKKQEGFVQKQEP